MVGFRTPTRRIQVNTARSHVVIAHYRQKIAHIENELANLSDILTLKKDQRMGEVIEAAKKKIDQLRSYCFNHRGGDEREGTTTY